MNVRPRRWLALVVRFSGLGLLYATWFASPAYAFEFANENGEWVGTWDTTISWGVQSRVEDRDQEIIGIANGGTAFGVNADDGDLNFDTGLVSNVLKITSELELRHANTGLFVRGTAFRDFEIEGQTLPHRQISPGGLDLVGSDVRLLDAYAWFEFNVGEMPSQLTLGQQVLSWGESTFIQGGINIINPVDVAAIRLPGAELREALIPVPMVAYNISLSDAFFIEAFYQLEWEKTDIDPPGAYFSSNDFVGDGGNRVQLGFGGIPEGPFNGVSRGMTVKPEDQDQWGLKLGWYSEKLNTEFGFFYVNYHSRLPMISARTGTQAGFGNAAAAGAAATCLSGGAIPAGCPAGDPNAAIAFGAATGTALGADDPVGAATAGVNAALNPGSSFPPGSAALAVSQTVTDQYAQTANYFVQYPENINLYGISFNTTIGDTAFQGEVSYRPNAPYQIDDLEILFTALSPLDALSGGSLGALGQLGPTPLNTPIRGFIETDQTQIQFTFTRTFPRFLKSNRLVLVAELGAEFYPDLPSKDQLRLDGPGTFISGNGPLASTGQVHVPTAIATIETPNAFPDDFAWGYRFRGVFQYLNAIGAVNFLPRFALSHDVSGVSPRPSGNFLEDRYAATVGFGFDYQRVWQWELNYTVFDGAGRYNLINDRDFVGFNVKYSF